MDDRPMSAAEKVYRNLRAAIVTGQLLPGTILSRADLAEEYAVSPTPVREALLRLEREALVFVRPQSSTIVAPIDVLALHQAHFLRVALEVEVVKKLSARQHLGVVKAARVFCRAGEDFQQIDRQFHLALFTGVGMDGLFARTLDASPVSDRFRALAPFDPAAQTRALQFHGDILDRIAAGDGVGAERAMRAHLADEIASLDRAVKDQPSYFSQAL